MSDDLASGPAANAALIARELKQGLVRHPLRANDVYPTMIASRVGEPFFAMCDLRNCWADRYNVLRDAVAVLAPDEVVLIFETFVSLTPDVKRAEHSLSERFRDGDPTVSAAIDVLRLTPTGEGEQVLLPYSYEGDNMAWNETPLLVSPGEPTPTIKLEGDIADSLMAGFAAAGKRYELDEARAALKSLGVRVRFAADTNPFLNVEPNDPCPCDSKRMFKDCHGY